MAERVCSKCGQAVPEAKAEGRIVRAARNYWIVRKKVGFELTCDEYLAPFRAIQAEVDSLRQLFRNHEARLTESRSTWLGKRIDKLNDRMGLAERRIYLLQHPIKPKCQPPPDYPTDRNGHRLVPGRSLVTHDLHSSTSIGLFLNKSGDDLLCRWLVFGGGRGQSTNPWSPEYTTWLFDLDLDERGDC